MSHKIIIIGIDGGTFNVIKPLVDRGKLPFFGYIMKNGTHGVLKSTFPPVTAPAWTSFMTGKNPGKHGLFDFQRFSHSGERELTYSTDCQSATIWDYLSELGKKILLVNVPMTYPPRPINGICVAGFPVPHNSVYTYPPDKHSRIIDSGYITDWIELSQRNKWASKLSLIKRVEKIRINNFVNLMNEESWDVSMIVISGTDHISHLEWQKGNRNVIENYYIFIDKLFNRLRLKGLFENLTIVVMSDHGFTQSKYVFYLNDWLRKEGYLSYDLNTQKEYDKFGERTQNLMYNKGGQVSKFLKKMGITKNKIISITKKVGLIKLEKYLPHFITSIFPAHNLIPDWNCTKAYMTSNVSKSININLKGRERHGIVEREDFNSLRSEIVEKLKAIEFNENIDIFEYLDFKERFYNGPYLEKAPDIILWPSNQCNIKTGRNKENCFEKVVSAHHATNGIFMMLGDNVKKEHQCNLNITDIVPTLMHILDQKCPDDLDGNVMKDVFINGSEPYKREVRFRKPLKKDFSHDLFDKETERIKQKLKSLGYI